MASSTSFSLFRFRKSTNEVINEGRNKIYDEILDVDRKLEGLFVLRQRLIKEGLKEKQKGKQSYRFITITNDLKKIEHDEKTYQTRKTILQRKLVPLEDAKKRLNDVATAKTIVSTNRRIISEMGGLEGVLDLQRSMEKTSMEMEDGVGSVIDELFEPEEGLSDEDNIMTKDELDKFWDEQAKSDNVGDSIDTLELRLSLLGGGIDFSGGTNDSLPQLDV